MPRAAQSTSPSKRNRRHATGASNQDWQELETVRATRNRVPPPFRDALELQGSSTQHALSPTANTSWGAPSSSPRSEGGEPSPSSMSRAGILPIIDRKRSFNPTDASLLQSSRVVNVPRESRPTGPVSETKTGDRTLTNKLNEKLWITGRTAYVRKVLHSCDKDGQGLTHEQLHAAMERLNLGFSEQQKARVVERLDVHGNGRVTAEAFLEAFDALNPLGEHMTAEQLKKCGLGNNVAVGKPWEARRGEMSAWKRAERGFIPGLLNNAEPGSFEQQKEDLYLQSLVAGKLNQHKDRLRLLFRQMDENKNSLVEKDEFVRAIQTMKMQVAPSQLERLFDLADRDGSGSVDYEEFIRSFETHDVLGQKLKAPPRPGGKTLAERMEIQPEEVAAALRSPLTFELRRRLYAKAGCAHAVFRQYDLNGDGQLSVDEIAKCCSALVPGMEKRDVAALMVKMDGSGDGYLDYREFIKGLVEEGPSNQRMVETELQRQEVPPQLRTSGWEHSPIWNRPVTPRSKAGTWSIPTAAEQQASRTPSERQEDQAVHDAAVASVLESLEMGVQPWNMDVRLMVSAGDAPHSHEGHATSGGGAASSVVASAAPLSQSLDLSSLYRPQGGGTGAAKDGLAASARAPLVRMSRADRFYDKKHPDTKHLTGAMEGTSQYAATSDTYVRKSDPQFLGYQSEDLHKKKLHQDQARVRLGEVNERVASGLARADEYAAQQEAARLENKGLAKQRYEERAVLYEEARRLGPTGGALFGRLNCFHEQDNAPKLRGGDAGWQ